VSTILYRSFAGMHADRLLQPLHTHRLRILCYHGVCDDRVANESWLPTYFVRKSAFASQLAYLRRHAHVLPLTEAVARLRDGSLPACAISVTFDDGYANNVHQALPLLEQYQVPASIFLSTSYVETGSFYPFLALKLLRLADRKLSLPDYKSSPIDDVLNAIARHWPAVEGHLSTDQRETLRPLTIQEVRRTRSPLIDFGAHSHTHCIARNETQQRRDEEVRTSVFKVGEWIGRPVPTFSYPNGEAGDFGDIEKASLRAAGIEAAVTGISGANRRGCDPFELRRYPLTLHHDNSRFRAEVSGFRSALMSATGWWRG
jgi:peptidoglycan/xylan/chitin deacetylase (PgdA/CDA1 family)